MSLIVPAPARRRLVAAWMGATVALILAACSGGSNRSASTPPVGTTAGVVLTSSTNTTQVQQGGSLVLTATVSKDPANQGVTWTLTGVGALSNTTTKSVTYTAPATGVTGITTPSIKATSAADTTQTATATLVVLGTPVINKPILFPANVGSPYGAGLSVSGGLTPFVWALDSGTLPPGLTLGTTSTTAVTSISGTPTATGTYNFRIKVTDHNTPAKVATVDLTVIVNPTAACLLNGQYALLYSGFVSNQMTVGAASITVATAGTLSGYHDFISSGAAVSEPVTGTCSTRVSNNGTLTLTGGANSPLYDYAVTTSLADGRIQLQNGADSQSGSGFFLKQDPAAFLQSALAGSFAFGTLGVQTDGARMGLAGALTLDVGGLVTDGHADSNGASALTDAALAGNLGAPDANGRGTLTLTATASGGNQTFHFAYYIVNSDRLLLVSTDTAPRLAGYMTRQSGAFSNASLASPGILSLWGAAAVAAPKSVLALGRLSGANAANGTVTVKLDTADQLSVALEKPFAGADYAVRAADGRATLSFVSGTATRQFALFLDGVANGYVIEHGSAVGSAGFLEAQTAGQFTSSVPGFFVSGTQFPQDAAPLVLLPSVNLADGNLSAGSATGFYTIDATTGRGLGSENLSGSGSALFVFYVVNPNKVVTFRTAALNRSAVMDWLGAN